VIMSNHQSFYDVPVLYAVLGGNLRMVAKKELFAVPIFSRAMREAGFIEVDRSNRQRALDSMKLARETLEKGVNVWIAPEGTRSRSGALGPFKKGGFYLAFESKLPILPVTLVGTRDALGAQALRSSAGARVRVTIAPPIDTAPYLAQGKGGREKLMAAVHDVIERGLT
jgi:1-acyl-sn-glycerol-3-phosphate acyltransferase